MTLLITVIAAVISTVIWYTSSKARELKTGVLLYMFWGASLMWLVDAVVEYLEAGAEFFTPSASDMLNDTFLGISVVALALVVWVIYLLIKDPSGTLKSNILNRNNR
ncbi:hypothetical protein SAMN02910447_03113 [Ruminococcus sp. YE71]|uniref:hypothetical protein n=1 Tax=unclassified Ruminococcus TaxID=2608920 RepID=UPI00089167B3|nr:MULTISPECIES: hypothetical protein [unclassified Ruminococcus]SDA29896.1 hypothetical protein SAMN02910446_03184 [Ruminococcus sp. YE78]SFW49004.1 hypothetical protein SAMN02910447_03113 [Ruminococcus sp. YE71]